MSLEKSYTISELAQAADVTTRTVRYYVAEELLPPPEGGGRVATYTDEHLARLALIKILKDEYLPLQEIRALLQGLDYQAVVELLEEKGKSENPAKPQPNSAKAYLQTLLKLPAAPAQTSGLVRHKLEAQQRSDSGHAPALSHGVTDQEVIREAPPRKEMESGPVRSIVPGQGEALGEFESKQSRAATPPAEPEAKLSRWQRFQLTPEVELHIKEGTERTQLWPKVEQLIKVARQILK